MQRCKVFEKKNSKANYKNPPIPSGFEHVCGKWNSGLLNPVLKHGKK